MRIWIICLGLLVGCGTGKVDENVTLHKREVYHRGQTSDQNPEPVVPMPVEAVQEYPVVEGAPTTDLEEMVEATLEEEIPIAVEETVTEAPLAKDPLPISEKAWDGNTSKERLGSIMDFLADDALEGRDTGSDGIEKAARYIEEYLGYHGVLPYFKSYRDTLPDHSPTAYNIVGFVQGADEALRNEIIVIGAHYDHIGIVPGVEGDSIANGANDNASGTAIVLELARHFGKNRTNGRSILFALFTAEEKGLLGATHLAKRLKVQKANLYTMLNFEMLGVPMKRNDYQVYLTGFDTSNMAGVCNMYAGTQLVGSLRQAKEYKLFERSDNYPFYSLFKIPAQTFSSFDFTNFDQYHKVGDERDRMDIEHMAKVVRHMVPVVEGISNSKEKIIRLNP